MKLAILISGGRTGSDFFQSLLDGHSEILSLPGVFFFEEYLEELNKRNINSAELFVQMYKKFFDSRLNKHERHDQLGTNKNEFYKIDENIFIKHFNEINKNDNEYELLKNLHLAYSFAKGESNDKKKLIFLHLHHLYRLEKLKFLKFDIFYTLRYPLHNLTAAINHWSKYEDSKLFSFKELCDYYDRVVNGIDYCMQYKSENFFIIKLEDIHLQSEKILNSFVNFYNLNFDKKILFQSTFHGKKWWGDAVGSRYLDGINKNYNSKIDMKLFNNKDIDYLNNKLSKINNKYYKNFNYTKENRINFYFPLKSEYQMLINNLSIKSLIKFCFFTFRRYRVLNKKFKNIYPDSLTDINL